MNQLIIGFVPKGECPGCGGKLRVRADLPGAGHVTAFIACPVCIGPEQLQAFVDQHTEGADVPPVIA